MPPSKPLLLSEPHHISEHANRMTNVKAVGVDTEFVRERTYYPRPGLMQFSDGEQVWLVDPVALEDCPALEDLVSGIMSSAAFKILHSTGEDLEVIEMIGHAEPSPLFDTQRAAALLGWPLQIRYELLAGELLGVEFPGGLGRNDWRRRPLPESWIEYAANDVIALPRMREVLGEKLARAGRLEWLDEDCRRILQRQHQVSDPVLRIKGAAGLPDEQLERLARLARWREEQARKRDIPRGFVIADPVALALARRSTVKTQDFKQFEGGRQRVRKHDQAAILALLQAGPSDFQRPPELHVLNDEQRARISEIQGRIKQIADHLGVEPAVIASKRDLTRMVQSGQCDWLNGWRSDLLNDS